MLVKIKMEKLAEENKEIHITVPDGALSPFVQDIFSKNIFFKEYCMYFFLPLSSY